MRDTTTIPPNKFHCPVCGARPEQSCESVSTAHSERLGNDWAVTLRDAAGGRHTIYCHDRSSRDQLARTLSSSGMLDISVRDRMVRRRNIMGGYFAEAEDTPLHLSPASETYWSM